MMGRRAYPTATALYITADAGGSNGYRSRAWKAGLQRLADTLHLTIHVSHFPPGTSEWNKIEHRLFCHITLDAQRLRHGAQRAEGRRSAATGRLCVGRRQAGTPRDRARLLPYLHNRIGTSRVGHERPPRGLWRPRLPVPTLPRGTASPRDGPRAPARARTHVALGRATDECGCMRGGGVVYKKAIRNG